MAGTTEGKEIAGRLAVKTNSGVLTDAVNVTAGPDGSPVAEQPNFGGSITVHSTVRAGTPVIAVRPNAVSPEPSAGAAAVEAVAFTASDAAKAARVSERVVAAKGERPELTEAQVNVLSGALGGPEHFAMIPRSARWALAVPDAVLNGPPPGPARLPGNAHFSFPGCEGDALLLLLDARGIACSTGSACTAGVAEPSHVLLAMGADADRARGSLRFSLGHTTTQADVDALGAAIGDAVTRARRAAAS